MLIEKLYKYQIYLSNEINMLFVHIGVASKILRRKNVLPKISKQISLNSLSVCIPERPG